ncbi:MAG: transcriptional repressor [Clostridiales bacterium]|nr:MAG: transcriptional repressor [Clostridiales bacterium]
MQVLEYLMNDDTHPTADVIFTNIHAKSPLISKATVYNTLNLFVEKGLISTMMSDKLEVRYDIVSSAHGHFVCKSCGKVYNFDYNQENHYSGLEGFDIENEEIVLKGICKNCKM